MVRGGEPIARASKKEGVAGWVCGDGRALESHALALAHPRGRLARRRRNNIRAQQPVLAAMRQAAMRHLSMHNADCIHIASP